MKRILMLLPLLLLVVACEDDAAENDEGKFMVGTWTVTNMGTYESANCTGALDYSSWTLAQGLGISMSFIFHEDGTIDMSTTAFGYTETESYTWNADTDEVCIDGECVAYVLSGDETIITFVGAEEPYCEDMDGEEVAMTETECASAGNDWYDAECYEYTMEKQ